MFDKTIQCFLKQLCGDPSISCSKIPERNMIKTALPLIIVHMIKYSYSHAAHGQYIQFVMSYLKSWSLAWTLAPEQFHVQFIPFVMGYWGDASIKSAWVINKKPPKVGGVVSRHRPVGAEGVDGVGREERRGERHEQDEQERHELHQHWQAALLCVALVVLMATLTLIGYWVTQIRGYWLKICTNS